jgi:hypothetical protein
MLPILLDITESLRPAVGSPGPSLLVPGESVQALVLEVQDPGRLVILVKGIPLSASSLAGPLEPGQVIQARVERANGQVFLKLEQPSQKLDQPVQTQPPQSWVLTGKGGQLPKDGQPSVDGRAGSASQTAPIPSNTTSLHGQDTADTVNISVSRRGGEKGLLPDANPGHSSTPVPAADLAPQRPAEAEQDRPAGQPEGTDQGKPQTVRGNPGNQPVQPEDQPSVRPTLIDGERQAFPTVSHGPAPAKTSQVLISGQPVQAVPPANLSDPAPIFHLLRTLLPADESFAVSLGRLLQSVRAAVAQKVLPEQAGSELERLHDRLVLKTGDPNGPRVKDALLAKGLQYEQSLVTLLEKGEEGLKGTVEPTLKGWLLAVLKAQAERAGAGPARAVSSGGQSEGAPTGEAVLPWPSRAPAQEPPAEWIKDARHLLRVIEREQVLNSLNFQSGQPLFVEVALGPWAVSSASLYVSRAGEEGTKEQQPAGRSYSLVTLLQLDGIGAIRVDALLTGKRIAARFMVERPEVERAVRALLPNLKRGLSAGGYKVETLAATVADPDLIRGEDLRARTVPDLNLINLRA